MISPAFAFSRITITLIYSCSCPETTKRERNFQATENAWYRVDSELKTEAKVSGKFRRRERNLYVVGILRLILDIETVRLAPKVGHLE